MKSSGWRLPSTCWVLRCMHGLLAVLGSTWLRPHVQGAYRQLGVGCGALAELWGSWLCILHPGFQESVRSLKVNMLPTPLFTIAVGPHFPSGSQDAVSDLLCVCSSKALGNMPCGNPGRGREDVGPYITFATPHSKEQFDTLG